jgi:REP element-mobilizing transposase RayT
MGYHLRYQSKPWATHHVVSRCVRGYSFLKPTPKVVSIISGVLGRALHMYSHCIKLHHYVFLSNHFHLLVTSEDIDALSEFMKYLKSNISRKLARIHEWAGPMWQSRFSSEEVLGEEGLIEIFKYITENSVKEGLVNHPREWKGLHGYHQLVSQKTVSGPWINLSAMHKTRKHSLMRTEVTLSDFTTLYRVNLTPPPLWEEMDAESYHQLCKQLTQDAIKSAKVKRKSEPMGMARVLAGRVDKARFVKRGQRPLCRTKCIDRLKNYKSEYFGFKARFQEVYRALRDGLLPNIPRLDLLFPSGGARPLGVGSLIQLE